MTYPVRILPQTSTEKFAPPQPVCRILARIGDARTADYAEQFPREMPQAQAFECLDMLRAWYVERGFEVRNSDVKANTGFVATLRGTFVAAYEVVSVFEN